ncbi:MAG: hypothetical protein J6U35_02890 [Clostridia bacterium]|nr:hypothetical protein [Clostridia bacterium]
MEKNIALLGSTGSIGRQVLEVVRRFPEFKIVSLAAHKNKALLEKQIEEFDPQVACLTGGDLLQGFGNTAVFCGRDSLEKAIVDDADIVFVAVTAFLRNLGEAVVHPARPCHISPVNVVKQVTSDVGRIFTRTYKRL